MKCNDLTNCRFDMLTALYPLKNRKDKCVMWMCRCDCGRMKAVPSTDLTRHRVKSCGCLKHRVKDISGERRGHLTALRPTGEKDARGHAIYEWQCDCGEVFTRSICGTAGSTGLMCPGCQAELKRQQIARARQKMKTEASTGLTKLYLRNLVHGAPTATNQSGVRGVHWHEGHKRWVATGRENGRLLTLGEFEDLDEARSARERFVQKTYGVAALKMGIELP